ncbi:MULTISPECIES: DUF4012 domain-containing protein [Microbacterium]|nr:MULTISPECIES: DUF4012 domain-containing protein [Microbacterium]
MTEYPVSTSRRVAGRVVAGLLAAFVAVLLLGGLWIGVRGAMAYGHVADARAAAADAQQALSDPAQAAEVIDRISEHTSAARALTGDPVWALAAGLPWIGPQLDAVATLTRTADEVATTAIAPLAEVATSFSVDSLRPQEGRFDIAALADLHEPAVASAERLAAASEEVARIQPENLLAPLREPVAEVQTLFADVATGADALGRATALMPAMLGAEGPRDYLVLFQNNAEWRSLGGIAGAMAVVRTEDGRISLSAQGSTRDFRRYAEPVLPLSPELEEIYALRPAQYVQNVTQIPDFTVGAPLAREMWQREFGGLLSGVVAVDPVTLSYLLEATGPVTLPTGDVLSAESAVPLLLNEVYQRYEVPADQDAFFAAATAAVFGTLTSGTADPVKLVDALARAGSEQRLYLWNADEADQAILDGTSLQGRLPETDAEATRFGVYLNDGTGSKMDYYMNVAASVGWCTDTEGSPDALLSVRLRSDAPADAATLPEYITGGGALGTPAGTTETVAYLYLPEGAEIVAAQPGGTASQPSTGFGGGMHEGRRVLTWATNLLPGEEATVTLRVRTPATPVLEAVVTPTMRDVESAELAPGCTPTGQ